MNDFEPTRHRPRKKDTNRWCKGKVGREHDWDMGRPWGEVKRWTWATKLTNQFKVDVCKTCGKQRWHRR